ncbi:response regulator [Massilia sp. 2TAF26]|uniref:response regulator n=1 Tax=Massilia sp. 2TAF26 TaxID=3233012 RepID=UPI003F9C3523
MRRILILDDEPGVLNALRRTLRSAFPKESVTIETFDDPESAVLRAGDQDFDVVISDFRMPGLNGADVLQLVKGLQPTATRIVVSATTDYADIIAAVNRAEVFRYLAKPWEHEELVATVREAFERRDCLMQSRPGQPAAQASEVRADQEECAPHQCELQQLEQEEPGITHVNWDEHGNIRLF